MSSLEQEIPKFRPPRRELRYSPDFKTFIKNNPGVMKTLMKLEGKLRDLQAVQKARIGMVLSEDNATVTLLDYNGMTSGHYGIPGAYLKLEVDDNKYFAKRIIGHPEYAKSKGVDEFTSLEHAKEALKGMDGVEVVDYQLGYQDDYGVTYFISKWYDGYNFEGYLGDLAVTIQLSRKDEEKDAVTREKTELERRFIELKKRLSEKFMDVTLHNILYVPDSKKMVIFDIHERNT